MSSNNHSNQLIVLHFIGAGRSGSTLLNIMLDNHPTIMGTGELSFFVHGWEKGDYCSCERPLRECPFWQHVKTEWLKQTEMTSLEDYRQLQERYERYRRLPLILAESKFTSPKLKRYQTYTAKLYEIIGNLSQAKVIVDSSKNPARALALANTEEIDLRFVLLMRDVRAYVWSKQKTFIKDQAAGLGRNASPMPVWQSIMRWIGINLLSTWVSKKSKNHRLIRYEDLVENIEPTFSSIGALIDCDLAALAHSIKTGQPFSGRHIQAGNRLRMKKNIQLKAEESWQDMMPLKQKALSWKAAGWLMKKYGYSK